MSGSQDPPVLLISRDDQGRINKQNTPGTRKQREATRSTDGAIIESLISDLVASEVNAGRILQAQASSTDPRGTSEVPLISPLRPNWTQSNFSEAGREFFTVAAPEGGVSQTHFVNPEAEMCYRCPLCGLALNPM